MAYLFFFDLDSTITKAEILPEIAKSIGLYREMQELTEQSLCGKTDYFSSLLSRIQLLSQIPVDSVQAIVSKIEVSEQICAFLAKYKEQCYIVTNNLDVWISQLIRGLGMEGRCFASACEILENYLNCSTISLLDKAAVLNHFLEPIVAVGDGENDIPMLCAATIGVAYGGARPLSQNMIAAADAVFYDDAQLCSFLEELMAREASDSES